MKFRRFDTPAPTTPPNSGTIYFGGPIHGRNRRRFARTRFVLAHLTVGTLAFADFDDRLRASDDLVLFAGLLLGTLVASDTIHPVPALTRTV